MRIRSTCLALAAGLLALPAVSLADEVQDQLKQMQERMSQLEDRLQATTDQLEATQQRAEDQQQVIEAAGLAKDGRQSGIASFLETLEVGGHVATSYNYNFNRPDNGGTNFGANGLRAFDTDSNGFALDQLKLQLERPVSPEQRAGFRADIYYGKTARILNSITDGVKTTTTTSFSDTNGNGVADVGEITSATTTVDDRNVGDGNEVHLSQAYVQYLIPNVDMKLQAGLFQTFIGAEVIDTWANYNISRSLLFTNAIPFEHLGVLLTKKYESGIDWGVGLVNGWDPSNGADLNNNKGLLARIGYGQDTWALGVNGYYGSNETVGDDSDQRGLVDVVLNLKPTDSLSMYLNADFGWEQFDLDTAGTADPDDFWYGFAAAGRYAITDRLGVSLRGEWMKDVESMFFSGGGVSTAGSPVSVWELTATLDYALTESLIARLEGRSDWANLGDHTSDRLFLGDSDCNSLACGTSLRRQSNQQTVSAELVYKF